MAAKAKKRNKLLSIKNLKSLIKSRSFIGSIIFAISLWAYTSLNSKFVPIVDVPLKIMLPQNKAVENFLPSVISIKVKGTGWDLFNLIFFNSSAKCLINLSEKIAAEGNYQVTRNEIMKGLQSLTNVEPIDVIPETLNVQIGLVGQYFVPVVPYLKIITRKGFIVAGAVIVEPHNVMISGNDKIVQTIKHWNTEPVFLTDVYKPLSISVSLSDSLKNMMTLSQNKVTIYVDVQQKTEFTLKNIEVKIRGGGSLPKSHSISPLKIDVTLQGGVDYITKISEDMVHAYIEYSDVINDSTGYLTPKISVADTNVKVLYLSPQFIYHKKIINTYHGLKDIKL